MPEAPPRADVVVIGAGIVGNGLAYHLARLGVGRIVLVDKGPLPNPGGSTGHASNFIFPIEHSKMMTRFTEDSVEQYERLGVLIRSGGIEVARTEERMAELRRKVSVAKAWRQDALLLSPAEVGELVPYLEQSVIRGGLYFPGTSVVDSLRAGTIMRDWAVAAGALTLLPSTEVTGITTEGGRVRSVRTDAGEIACDLVAICCGVWSPRIARMAGATIPLTPAVHQMISVGPIAAFADSPGEISFPIVRDVDKNMYERQHGSDMGVGSYAHRPILIEPDEIPSIEESALSPTEMPFTSEDFDPQMEDALELMPGILGDEHAGVRYAINGLISLTPDGHPLIGETETKGVWSVAASWIKEGPSIARTAAEWICTGITEIDAHEADVARFWRHQRTRAFVRARAEELFNKTYGIVHPAEQYSKARALRRPPAYERQRELGATFFETAGWERPYWYESNQDLLERYSGRVTHRAAEWDARWWSPIVEAEHLALREGVGMVDLSAFSVIDVRGPGALDLLQQVAVAEMDVPVGRVVYTSFLDPNGGFQADLTVMRLGQSHFRVVTGGGTGPADLAWLEAHAPDDGSAIVVDASSAWTTLGLWGPEARSVLSRLTPADVSHQAFRFGTCRPIELGPHEVLASRISYVGELGWELYIPFEQGASVWELLWEAGQPEGIRPIGVGVYLGSGRLEKGYRAFGAELDHDFDLVEAGMERRSVKRAHFVGKDAYLARRSRPPAAMLCTLSVDWAGRAEAERRYPLGGEAIVDAEGQALVDAKGRGSYVTSAGPAPSLGKYLLMAYLPEHLAKPGAAGLMVECMGERFGVDVEVAGSTPLFDPANERLRS
jgi:glycine cleavage system aminomethyltransferase T/glycine/D-amino acid oxidase-like deaminating enzyme